MREMTPREALNLAETMLGGRVHRLERFCPQAGGFDSTIFRLWVGSEAMLLKIMKRPGVPVGLYFHGRLEKAGIPVPRLHAFSPDAGPEGQACVIWEWVDGSPFYWPKGAPCPFDEGEFGELLRRIHELRFDGPFGFLGNDPANRSFSWSPHLSAASDTWRGFFDFASASGWLAAKGYLDPHEAEVFLSLPDRLSGLLSKAKCRLLHTDLKSNLILDSRSRRIRAVLDYTDCCAGDPRWELALVDYWFSDRIIHYLPFDMERFRAVYGATHNPKDDLGRFYLAAILATDELVSADPDSLKGKWALATLKSIIDSFDA